MRADRTEKGVDERKRRQINGRYICTWCGEFKQKKELYIAICARCTLKRERVPLKGKNLDFTATVQYRAFQALWNAKHRGENILDHKWHLYETFRTRFLVNKNVRRHVSNEERFIECILATCDTAWLEAQQDNPERIKQWEELYGSVGS
jgi:hypothetical protein